MCRASFVHRAEVTSAAPSRMTTLLLLGGRAVFRGAQWVSTALLAFLWGNERFAGYAAAMGVTAWLMVVASSGLEKAILAIAVRRDGQSVPRQLLSLVLACQLVISAGCVVIAMSAASDDIALIAAAIVYSTSVGVAFVAVAALRLTGRPWADAVVMSAVGLSQLAGAGLAATGWGPRAVLGTVAAMAFVITFAAAVFGWAVSPPRTPTSGRLPGPTVLGAAIFLGVSEICNMLGTAIVYAVLAASAYAAQASYLYLAGVVAQIVLGVMLYLNRLAAPLLASRAESGGETSVLSGAARLFGLGFFVALAALCGNIALLVAGQTGAAAQLVITVAMIAATPAFLFPLHASARAEYSGAVGRRSAAAAAVAGLAASAAMALVLVPVFGAPGGLVGMVAGCTVQAGAGWWLLRRRVSSASAPETAAPPLRRTVP